MAYEENAPGQEVPQSEAADAERERTGSADAPEATGTEGSLDEVEASIEDELARARAEAADWQDRFVRLHAEWDTYRRRTNEARAEEKLRAAEGLVGNLIPVIDDFERCIAYAEGNGEAELLSGVKQVHAKLVDALRKENVEVIDPVGEPFDALSAQAVAKVDDPEAFDETVAQVYQKGYRMGRKVIRTAMVTVTTGGPKRPAEESPQGSEA